MELYSQFLKVYDNVFYRLYRFIEQIYSDSELKIFYTIYTILIFDGILLITPLGGVIIDLTLPEEIQWMALIIYGVLILPVYKWHTNRYVGVSKEFKKKIEEPISSKDVVVFIASVVVCSSILWYFYSLVI
jgi:hypothetical protein